MDEIIIILVVLGYVLNVLLARKMNRVIYNMNNFYYPVPRLWFVPVLPLVVFLVVIVIEKWGLDTRFDNWVDDFRGENW